MKFKALIFLLPFLLGATSLLGQTICLENDDTWTGSGLANTTGQGCDGDSYVFNSSGDTATSPIVTNPQELKFKLRRSSNSTSWSMVVEISNNTTHTTFTTVETISSITATACASLSYITVDLSAYTGERRIRFRDNRSTGIHERTASDVTLTCGASGNTVTFHPNGGTGTMTPQTSSSAANLTTNTFTRTGYAFSNWHTTASGIGGTTYTNGQNYTFSANLNLYAQWSINQYNVSYNLNGGTGTIPTTQTANYNTSITLADDSNFSRVGYIFTGWNTTADGSGTTYLSGSNFNIPVDNTTLYAQWVSSTPYLNVSATSLGGFNYVYGSGPSTVQSFTLSGGNLDGSNVNAVLIDNDLFEASSDGTNFSDNVVLTAYTGNPISIYVRLKSGLDVLSYDDVILIGGGGVLTANYPEIELSGTVSPKSLTINGVAGSNKVYDGNISAILSGTANLNGVVGSDDVTLVPATTISFNNENVGTNKPITVNYSLTGAKANNYIITQPNLSANITTKELTVIGATAQNKVYDSTITATITGATLAGVISPDVVNVSGGGAFNNANAENNKPVTANLTLSGADAGNYTLTQPIGLTANITKANPVFTTSIINLNTGGTYSLPGANISSTSNGLFSYSITTGGHATLSGTTLTGATVGTETLTINQAETTNYNAGTTTVSVNVTTITYVNGDYRTTGTGNWVNNNSSPAIWERYNGTTWITSNSPSYSTSNSVYIRNGNTITTGGGFANSVNLKIMEGGVFNVSHQSTTASIHVYDGGILNIGASFTNNGDFVIDDNGTVNLNGGQNNYSSLWNGTEKFAANSNFNVNYANRANLLFATNAISVNTDTESLFGNLTIQPTIFNANGNWTGMFPNGVYKLTMNNFTVNNSSDRNFTFNGGDFIVGGDFTVNLTSTDGEVATRSSAGTQIMTVQGNVVKNGVGMFRMNGSGNFTLNIDGNLQVNNGNFRLGGSNNGSTYTYVNLKGDVVVTTDGFIDSINSTTNTNFNFTGTGDGLTDETTQTIDIASTSTLENRSTGFSIKNSAYVRLVNRNFELGASSKLTVENGGTLDFGFNGNTALNVITSGSQNSMTFTSEAGSILKITSPDGITTTANLGNIQTPVTGRTYSPDGTFHYIGKVNQNSGNGLPNTESAKNVIVELDQSTLTFQPNGLKNMNASGNLEIRKGIVLDNATGGFEGTGMLTMNSDDARYQLYITGINPRLTGVYNLTAGVVEFASSQVTNQTIRNKSYQNIEITGNNVGNSNGTITLNPNGLFTVKTGGIFNMTSQRIDGTVGIQTVAVENGGIFKTEHANGFNGLSTGTAITDNIENIILQLGSTIEYSRAGNQYVTNFIPGYQNLRISGNETKTLAENIVRINEDLTVHATSVSNNLSLNIEEEKTLFVNNSIITPDDTFNNEGNSLVVRSNANLIQVNNVSNTGKIRVERITRPMNNYSFTYWGSPVNTDLGDILWHPETESNVFDGLNDTSVNTSFTWMPSTASWDFSQIPYLGNMNAGIGYIIKSPNSFDNIVKKRVRATFVGEPNNGNIPVGIVGGADVKNFLSNPYPSAINIDDFLEEYGVIGSIIVPTIYLWTHASEPTQLGGGSFEYTGSDFATYTLLGGTATAEGEPEPTGKVASGQGFFIDGNTSGQVIFKNSYRYDNNMLGYNNGQFFKVMNNEVSQFEKHRFWLNLKGQNTEFKQTLIGYSDVASDDLDILDGAYYDGGNTTNLYTLIDSKPFIIQAFALPFDDNDVIPLGYNVAETGSYTISLDDLDGLFENQDIFIKDNLFDIVYNLKEEPYEFTTELGTFENRLEVVFKPNGGLNINNPDFDNNWNVYTKKEQINLESIGFEMKDVYIYDMLGREIYKKQDIKSNHHSYDKVGANQVLIIKMISKDNQVFIRKIVN